MDILLLVKELLVNKELVRMFLFTFTVLFLIFKDASAVAKVLRKLLTFYIIVAFIIKLAINI